MIKSHNPTGVEFLDQLQIGFDAFQEFLARFLGVVFRRFVICERNNLNFNNVFKYLILEMNLLMWSPNKSWLIASGIL